MSGMLVRIKGTIFSASGAWSSYPRSIKVVYVAGWSSDELTGNITDHTLDGRGIVLGTLITMAEYYNAALSSQGREAGSAGPFKREKLGDYEYETSGSDAENLMIHSNMGSWVPERARRVMQPYYRVDTLVM